MMMMMMKKKKNPWMEKRPDWSLQENKLFEDALAYFDKDTPDRWLKVAEMIPGKAAADVMAHYQDLVDDVNHIEAGMMIPSPGYSSSFTLDWESTGVTGAVGAGARTPDHHERKKGVPWTEEEHKLFLMGLKKYGKGDWRNISRNFVVSRTPTQVASHAQKYFIRLGSGSKEKRRSSIHDITTANLPNNRPPSPPQSSSSDQFSAVIDPHQRNEVGDHHYAVKLETIHSHISACDSMIGRHGSMFRTQPENPWPHGY